MRILYKKCLLGNESVEIDLEEYHKLDLERLGCVIDNVIKHPKSIVEGEFKEALLFPKIATAWTLLDSVMKTGGESPKPDITQAAKLGQSLLNSLFYSLLSAAVASFFAVLTKKTERKKITYNTDNIAFVRSNINRYNQPVNMIYGKHIIFPDLVQPPYATDPVSPDIETNYIYAVGLGDYDVEANSVKLGSLNLTENTEYFIVRPGEEYPVGFPSRITKNLTSFQELDFTRGLTLRTGNDSVIVQAGAPAIRTRTSRGSRTFTFDMGAVNEVDENGAVINGEEIYGYDLAILCPNGFKFVDSFPRAAPYVVDNGGFEYSRRLMHQGGATLGGNQNTLQCELRVTATVQRRNNDGTYSNVTIPRNTTSNDRLSYTNVLRFAPNTGWRNQIRWGLESISGTATYAENGDENGDAGLIRFAGRFPTNPGVYRVSIAVEMEPGRATTTNIGTFSYSFGASIEPYPQLGEFLDDVSVIGRQLTVLTAPSEPTHNTTGMTLVGVKIAKHRASEDLFANKLGNIGSTDLSLVVTRRLPYFRTSDASDDIIRNPITNDPDYSTPVATQSAVAAFMDAILNNSEGYGARLTEDNIDIDSLVTLDTELRTAGYTFNYRIGKGESFTDLLQTIAGAAGCVFVQQSHRLLLVRDVRCVLPKRIIFQNDIMQGSAGNVVRNDVDGIKPLIYSMVMPTSVIPDHTDVTYVNSSNWQNTNLTVKENDAILNVNLVKNLPVDLDGITNHAQAVAITKLALKSLRYRKNILEFSVENIGLLLKPYDTIGICDSLLPMTNTSGVITAYNSTTRVATLSENISIDSSGDTYYILLQGRDGEQPQSEDQLSNRIALTNPMNNTNTVTLATAPSFSLATRTNLYRTRYVVGKAASLYTLIKIMTVTPVDRNIFNITAVIDRPETYEST